MARTPAARETSKPSAPAAQREETNGHVPAVVRAARILDELTASGGTAGVSELARSLGLPKSSIHGICRTLADMGVLVRVGQTQFAIGPHVLAWANAFHSQSSIVVEFQRVLEGRRALLKDEALNLSVLTGRQVMYVACRSGSNALGLSFRTGMSLPAEFTATGKAMLSTYPEGEVETLLKGVWPRPITPSSVRSLSAFKRELDEVRRVGYSVDNGQLREGMQCYAAPIFGAEGDVAVAGIAVGLLSVDVTDETHERCTRDIVTLANELSRRLGAQRTIEPPRVVANTKAKRAPA